MENKKLEDNKNNFQIKIRIILLSPSNETEGLGKLLTADSDLDMTSLVTNLINESIFIQINVVNVSLGTKITLDLVVHGKSSWEGFQGCVTRILSIYPDFRGEGLRLWGRMTNQKVTPLDMVRKSFT